MREEPAPPAPPRDKVSAVNVGPSLGPAATVGVISDVINEVHNES